MTKKKATDKPKKSKEVLAPVAKIEPTSKKSNQYARKTKERVPLDKPQNFNFDDLINPSDLLNDMLMTIKVDHDALRNKLTRFGELEFKEGQKLADYVRTIAVIQKSTREEEEYLLDKYKNMTEEEIDKEFEKLKKEENK